MNVELPDDLVLVGHVSGAYGLQGWVRVRPYSSEADALLNARTWWLDKPVMRDVEIMQSKMHGEDVVARIMGCSDRDAAELLKGAVVHVSRKHFPALSDNEFYWVDLIGLDVITTQGETLGQVAGLIDNGAHPILRVALTAAHPDEKSPAETLIPFVDQYVKAVDIALRKVTVDWGRDY